MIEICKNICKKISKWAWEDTIEELECSLIRSRNECKDKTQVLESIREDLNDKNIDLKTLSTELDIIKLQNKKLDNMLSKEKDLSIEYNDLIFGCALTNTKIFVDSDEVKSIIKGYGTRARTLFNLDYDTELLYPEDITNILQVFDINRVPENDNPALHLKSVFEASQFSESAFGIARNKDEYFNIFIGIDKKLYVIDLYEKKISEYTSEFRFTQYWM
jgi:hypothetical protein